MADGIHDSQFHYLSGKKTQRPIGEPLRRLAQTQRDHFGFLFPIEHFLSRRCLPFFAIQCELIRNRFSGGTGTCPLEPV